MIEHLYQFYKSQPTHLILTLLTEPMLPEVVIKCYEEVVGTDKCDSVATCGIHHLPHVVPRLASWATPHTLHGV